MVQNLQNCIKLHGNYMFSENLTPEVETHDPIFVSCMLVIFFVYNIFTFYNIFVINIFVNVFVFLHVNDFLTMKSRNIFTFI